ncbi:hypothetical protein [Methylomonas sp. AM2-LC]|uniref:hypothetical protein n=1 Tax=Methylomonas sp. AM2-LC TaxID=3153301 RepID=UPI0032645554
MTWRHIEDTCRAACLVVGVEFKTVPSDGRWHTANLLDDHKGRNDGRIKVFPDQQGGIVWNHKTGDRQTFFINSVGKGVSLSPEERRRIETEQAKRQAEQLDILEKAAQRAVSIWSEALPAPVDHPYLVRKQIKPYSLRVGKWKRVIKTDSGQRKTLIINNSLLLPLFNESGAIRSMQAIFPETHSDFGRDKDFIPGGGLAGLFWWIGAKTETVLIAEGFATGATLHDETGYRVYLAFTANNLLAVGRIVREKLPDASIIFCADNDKTAGNPGLTKATEAAAYVGGSVAVPPIWGDFNEYAIFLKAGNHVR